MRAFKKKYSVQENCNSTFLVFFSDVWGFPYKAYENGGGAFLIPYMIVMILIGRPMYFLELVLGQFSSKSSIKIWDVVPAFRGKN